MPVDGSIDTWRLAFDVFQFAFTCAIGVYAWVATRQKAASDKLDAVAAQAAGKINALEQRLGNAEARLEFTPTSQALHEVAISNERLAGELKKTTAELHGLNELVQRLDRITERQESYLLQKKGSG